MLQLFYAWTQVKDTPEHSRTKAGNNLLLLTTHQGLRDVGDSIVLMGKNTMMKRSIRLYCERTGDESWLGLTEILVGNVGLIFTKGDLAEVPFFFSMRSDTSAHGL